MGPFVLKAEAPRSGAETQDKLGHKAAIGEIFEGGGACGLWS